MKKKINKKRVLINSLGVAAILGIGYSLGIMRGGQKFSEGLDVLARTGLTLNKNIDGKDYILSVTEKITEIE